MKLDLRAMLAGEIRTMAIDFPLTPAIDSEDPMSHLYGVRFPSPMEVRGQITNDAGYMRMTVEIRQEYEAECARCLAPVGGLFTHSLEKTVAPSALLRNLDEDKRDEYAIVEDGFLDLDDLLTETLEMEFPSRFLCSESCLGICPVCGRNRNESHCTCDEKQTDPRLAPLAAWLEENKKNG